MEFKIFLKVRNILLSSALAFITLTAEAQSISGKAVLFSIDQKPVSVDEFVFLYRKNHRGRDSEFTKEKIEEYLTLFINFKLKVKEAESRGLHLSDAFVKELNSYKEELKRPFVAEASLLDKLTREAYDRMGQEIKASHILIMVKSDAPAGDTLVAYNRAIEIKKRLTAGASFKEMAEEFSEDPSAKSNGGNLGYFSALQMVYPFEEAAFRLPVGEVSQPVRTRFGYHLIKVEDKRISRGEVEVSHILIRGADESSKKSIDKVYAELKDGGDWNSLCSQYSQDPGTKDSGGRLRPFGPGALASAPQFEETAFAMDQPGDISVPFSTPFGWHIIRLEKKIPLAPFNEMEATLKRRVAKDDRMAISKSIESAQRKKKLNYKEGPDLNRMLSTMADSSVVKGEWHFRPEKNWTAVLFSVGASDFSAQDFGIFVGKIQTPTNISPLAYMQQLYDQFVEGTLSEIEDKKLQQENPEYRNLVNEYREGILLFSIMEKEVWNKASEDSVGQRKYYEDNLQKYNAGLRVEARIFSTDNQDIIASTKNRIAQGDTLRTEELKKFKSISDFRPYEKGDHKAIDAISWTIGLHETQAGGMYYLVEVSRLVPPGQKKFEEVRASVISDYQDYLEKNWVEGLKSKYSVEVNKKGKKQVLAQLTKEKP